MIIKHLAGGLFPSIMHRFSLFLFISFYALIVSAVPAKRERCTLTLADGSTIEATWMGDESMHFYLTDDGKCLQEDEQGIAHFVNAESLQNRWKAKSLKRQAAREQRTASRRRKAKGGITGQKRGLVILIEFPQTSFHFTNADFQRFFNEKGYTDEVNIGSVHDYFLDASYGQFDFSFDIVGPVELDNPLSHYGSNNSNGDDQLVATMVAETIDKVDEDVDFSQYDWDGDGEVEQIFLIHSGYDEAQTRVRSDIWSHAWTLTEAMDEGDGEGPVEADGVIIDSYACSAELRGKSNYNITGIGTACHEFTHCFGIPDTYDTIGNSFGMYTWDLMDYGEYNGGGGTPAGFTSYERMFCGWLRPRELSNDVIVKGMPPLTSMPVAYILRNSGKEDEYYLLENRQQESWDKYIGGHGMLILHVDYDSTAWADNEVNTIRSHQRMTIIPADNTLYTFTLAGDPWPGTSGNTELSDNSTPVAKLFNKNAEGDYLMHHSIREISESDEGFISFVFDEEALGLKDLKDFKDSKDPKDFIFNLAGQRIVVTGKSPGIYIQGGKKLLIR